MGLLRQIREWLRLPQSKKLFEIPKQTKRDGRYWFKEAYRKSKGKEHFMCPWKGCEGTMLDGPTGGMSINIKCDTCERKWNLTTIMDTMERI